ncbi:MAG: glycosyltransferase family 2 protein [Thermodesulfobacteriota bacterium]
MPASTSRPPLISVITACRNAGEFLEETVQSVLAQTYPHLEYLIIDGGSTDNTVAIIRRYAARLAYWHSRPDRGPAQAFNFGLAQARGRWLVFLNADDFFLGPTVVEEMAVHLLSHPEADVVFGQMVMHTRERQSRPLPLSKTYGQPWRWQKFRWSNTLPHPAAFTQRQYFARVGGFAESFHIAMDYEHYLRAGPGLKAHYVPLPVSGMRAGGLSHGNILGVCREVREAQLKTGALPPGLAWANFFGQVQLYFLCRLGHRLLDRWAGKIVWPGRVSRNQGKKTAGPVSEGEAGWK